MASEPDLTGFPILRLDQITIIDSDILRRALGEAVDILRSYEGESEKPKIAGYLQKQVQSIRAELTKRAASDRILAMLEGAVDPLKAISEPYPYPYPVVPIGIPTNIVAALSNNNSGSSGSGGVTAVDVAAAAVESHGGSEHSPRAKKSPRKKKDQDSNSKPPKLFTPMPLPSEIILQKKLGENNSNNGNNTNNNNNNTDDISKINRSLNFSDEPDRASSASETRRVDEASDHMALESETSQTSRVRPQSGNDVGSIESIYGDGDGDGTFGGEIENPFKPSKKKDKRRSNNLSNNVPDKDYEKKAIAVMNQNFGSTFVVLATEKKKRFYPQKTEKQKELEQKEAKVKYNIEI